MARPTSTNNIHGGRVTITDRTFSLYRQDRCGINALYIANKRKTPQTGKFAAINNLTAKALTATDDTRCRLGVVTVSPWITDALRAAPVKSEA